MSTEVRSLAARACGALSTGALLVLAFPAPDQGWIAWFALAPLLVACHGIRPAGAGFLGLVSGVAAACGIYVWMVELPGFHVPQAVILALCVGFYPACWGAGLPLLRSLPVPLLLTAPALWVVLDHVKANAGFLALPWATLAHSQHRDLAVLQVAGITGEAGVTFLVVMSSVALAESFLHRAWRGALLAAAVIAGVHLLGAITLLRSTTDVALPVAVVQPSMLLTERETPEGRAAILNRLERLTFAAAATRPALIAWPETAVGDLTKDHFLVERLRRLVDATETPLLVGAAQINKFTRRGAGDGLISVHTRAYNAAYLLRPHEPIGEPYRKMRLLPFGEYVPLAAWIRWPEWLVSPMVSMTPGESRRGFLLEGGARLGVLICWENLFADHVRATVRDGASLLVQLTNDVWFGNTSAPRQHNLASVLRAVENRTPVVIASNTGPSEIIDATGRVVAVLPLLYREGILTARVSLGSGGSVYSRTGDLFVLAAFGVLALGALGSALRRPNMHGSPLPTLRGAE